MRQHESDREYPKQQQALIEHGNEATADARREMDDECPVLFRGSGQGLTAEAELQVQQPADLEKSAWPGWQEQQD